MSNQMDSDGADQQGVDKSHTNFFFLKNFNRNFLSSLTNIIICLSVKECYAVFGISLEYSLFNKIIFYWQPQSFVIKIIRYRKCIYFDFYIFKYEGTDDFI